jgi:hypothetical protein
MSNPLRYQVPDDTPFVLSFHMLCGFAAELYLKAFLMHKGYTEDQLRKVPKGFAFLRSEIRKEKSDRLKEKNERWQYWELRTKVVVALATALTGLVGALIGWAAIWK